MIYFINTKETPSTAVNYPPSL